MYDRRARHMAKRPAKKPDDNAIEGPDCWHPPFYQLVIERLPPSWQAHTEFELSKRARRIDMVLERIKDPGGQDGQVLRGLWPRLSKYTVLEFKSAADGFAKPDLLTLIDYGVQYHQLHIKQLTGPSDLTLVLVVPGLTPSLTWAIQHMDDWKLEPLGNGYARIVGAWYTTYIAFSNEVCEAEDDDYLRLFSQHKNQANQAMGWMIRYFTRKANMSQLSQMEGFDQMLALFARHLQPEQVTRLLSGIPPEQVLAQYDPEQRLAGLDPEQRLAGLDPEQVARALRSLPPEILDGVRKKLNGS